MFAGFGQVSLYCGSEAVLPEAVRCDTFILGVAAFRDDWNFPFHLPPPTNIPSLPLPKAFFGR